jgi:hypothetical protein
LGFRRHDGRRFMERRGNPGLPLRRRRDRARSAGSERSAPARGRGGRLRVARGTWGAGSFGETHAQRDVRAAGDGRVEGRAAGSLLGRWRAPGWLDAGRTRMCRGRALQRLGRRGSPPPNRDARLRGRVLLLRDGCRDPGAPGRPRRSGPVGAGCHARPAPGARGAVRGGGGHLHRPRSRSREDRRLALREDRESRGRLGSARLRFRRNRHRDSSRSGPRKNEAARREGGPP